jgi:hypothetical protein
VDADGAVALLSLELPLNTQNKISFLLLRNFHTAVRSGTPQPWRAPARLHSDVISEKECSMKKTLAVMATVAAVGIAAATVPAPAEARGIGPGLAFGLAAGAITAGALAATSPYYYGPGYGYYGPPAYYAYGPGPYAYYGGGPVYYRHYYHHYRYW